MSNPTTSPLSTAFEKFRAERFGAYAEYPLDAATHFGAGWNSRSEEIERLEARCKTLGNSAKINGSVAKQRGEEIKGLSDELDNAREQRRKWQEASVLDRAENHRLKAEIEILAKHHLKCQDDLNTVVCERNQLLAALQAIADDPDTNVEAAAYARLAASRLRSIAHEAGP